jgi:hypothetical protein
MSNFLSGIAVILSLLASVFSGFTAYRVFNLEQQVGALSQSTANQPAAQTAPSPASNPSSPPAANAAGIQPGQFIQSAFGNKAQVELLAIKRIQDPEAGARDVVNVQFRVRRLVRDEETNPYDKGMYPRNVKARNPDTSETYEALGGKRATSDVNLNFVKRGASVDAYVWLKVPEAASTLDIYIPETQVFKNVPIAN